MTETRQMTLVSAINKLLTKALFCHDVEQAAAACLETAQEITGSAFGFIGEVNAQGLFDTIAISNPGWDACSIPKSAATLKLTGMTVRGLWGKVIRENRSFMTNDPASNPDSVGLPGGHPKLTSFLGVPMRRGGEVTGMISLANAPHGYTDQAVEAVEALSLTLDQVLKSKRYEVSVRSLDQVILDLSTPVLNVWDGILAAPLIGTIDSQRALKFMEAVLDAIHTGNVRVLLVDITGVPVIDTQTGQYLIEAFTAARLLGAEVILTGVSPAIAQTLVHLGIRMDGVETCASLAAGIRKALALKGLAVVPLHGKEAV